MQETIIKIGEGGRIIIPASYRKAMDINQGDELVIRIHNGELRLFQQTEALKRIRTTLKKKTKKNYTEDFLSFRKDDSGE